MAHDTHAHAAHPHDHDANAVKVYLGVLAVLLVLTAITVFVAFQIQFESGLINVIIALGIATIKAALVALYFMHLRHDRPMNAVILIGSFVFLGIFLVSCYTDYATRDGLLPSNLKAQEPPKANSGAPNVNPAAPGLVNVPSNAPTPAVAPAPKH